MPSTCDWSSPHSRRHLLSAPGVSPALWIRLHGQPLCLGVHMGFILPCGCTSICIFALIGLWSAYLSIWRCVFGKNGKRRKYIWHRTKLHGHVFNTLIGLNVRLCFPRFILSVTERSHRRITKIIEKLKYQDISNLECSKIMKANSSVIAFPAYAR